MANNPKQPINQLGQRLAIYKPGTGRVLLLGVFLILLGLPCTIVGVKLDTSPTVYSNSSSLEGFLMSTGFVLGLIGIVAVILAFANRRLRVDLYEQGFVLRNKQGTQEIRWDRLTHVWHKVEETTLTTVKDPQTGEETVKTRKTATDVYALQDADGTTWELNTSFYGLSTFAPVLEQTYPRALLPGALASYEAGTPLTFGTLTVSSSGVKNTRSDGEVQLKWGSFHAIEVNKSKGSITVRRGDESHPWSLISITDTPNIAVFEALVNTIAGKQ